MEIEYHYPPDLFQHLVEAIPLLCRSKRDVLSFFAGVGVEPNIVEDLKQKVCLDRDSIRKHEIVREVLTRLNELGDKGLATRRRLIHQIVNWQDFTTCYSDNQQKAEEMVRRIASFVHIKDARTQAEEIEKSRKKIEYQLLQNNLQQKREEITKIRKSLLSLFHQTNPQLRGKLLESVLNQYFKASELLVREAFILTGSHGEGIVEQVDGVIEIDGTLYLVEMKWWQNKIDVTEISRHVSRLYCRSQACGIFISASGFTKAAIELCREALQQKLIILCELQEFIVLLEQEQLLKEFFKEKIHAAIIEKNPLCYPLMKNVK